MYFLTSNLQFLTSKLSSDDGREVTPVSIPNTEVKLSCAEGSTQVQDQDVARQFRSQRLEVGDQKKDSNIQPLTSTQLNRKLLRRIYMRLFFYVLFIVQTKMLVKSKIGTKEQCFYSNNPSSAPLYVPSLVRRVVASKEF